MTRHRYIGYLKQRNQRHIYVPSGCGEKLVRHICVTAAPKGLITPVNLTRHCKMSTTFMVTPSGARKSRIYEQNAVVRQPRYYASYLAMAVSVYVRLERVRLQLAGSAYLINQLEVDAVNKRNYASAIPVAD